MRVYDYFNSGKLPQFIIKILNVAFTLIVFNQIAFLSATLVGMPPLNNTEFVCPNDVPLRSMNWNVNDLLQQE
jgi:hypothetical protein